MPGWQEILLICFIVLILFGSKRIPEIARSLGRASREFRDAKDGIIDEINREPAVKDSEKSQDKSKEEK